MKKLFVLTLCVLVIGSLVAEAADPIIMKIAHSMPTDSARHRALVELEKYMTEKAGGRIKVELYPSGQLGNETEMLEATKLGSIEASLTGIFDAITTKLNLYYVPFFFSSVDDLMRVAKGDVGALIAKDAEKNGIKLLAVGDAGSRHMTNNARPIKTPADLKGLKMRTPPQQAIIRTMEALGANPVSIPFVEVYMALKTGVADGQENPFMNIVTMKFQEVQKHITVMPYIMGPEPFVVNLAWYNSLPEDLQNIVTDGAWFYIETQNRFRAESEERDFQVITDAGLEIYYPTEEQRKMFIEASKPVSDWFINSGFFTREELEAVRKVALNN